MRFLRFIMANALRKKTRALLTVGSFVVALFLFGLLATIEGAFSGGIEVAGADRLIVINRVSLIQPLPLAYKERLAQIDGVTDVTFANWFGGVYQDERNFFPQFAVDHTTYREMFPEFVIPDEHWQAFAQDRQGCIVGEALVKRFGWKLGDRIPLRGTIFQGTWEFNIVGIYTGARPQDDTTQFWFRWDYLEENGPSWVRGIVGWYTVRVANPDDAAQVVRAIDERFANSPWETKTDTEKAWVAGFIKQFGNIKLLMLSIGGVVFFTLLLVTGNTMAMAVRERTGELGVIKTLGFSDGGVLGLVLAESLLFAIIGGGLGIGLAKLFTMGGDPTGGFLPAFYLTPGRVVAGLVLALATGAMAGALPALAASRLRIVDALRRV